MRQVIGRLLWQCFALAAAWASIALSVHAVELSDQQIQVLKQQYLGTAKPAGETKSSTEAKEIAAQQQVEQPTPVPVDTTPSAIEKAMRARLVSDLMQSVQVDIPANLKNSDLAKPEVTEKHDMARSRNDDLNLRSSWERFVENKKVRGVDGSLSQFGYQLFYGVPNTFLPASDIPVPPEYVLGPGDELQIQFYGSRDDSLNLVIDREGVIELPKVGSLTLAGLSFVQAKALIAEQVRQKMIGVTNSVTMGRLRSIRVFVLGDAEHPGSYLVSGLSTMTHALFAAGGISKQGSLRHIQLKRRGKTIKQLDLYDFLLKGDSRGDERLMPGDVIFVPPIGPVIGVTGQVNRPAIYELDGEKTAQEITEIAGGILPDADARHVQIDRLDQTGNRNILDFDLKQPTKIQNGDIVLLFAMPGMRTETVSLLGHIKRPGQYGWRAGMKLSDLLASTDELLPGAFLGYALIQRTEPVSRIVTTLRVSLDALLIKHDKQADALLQADDQIYVFSKASIDPLNYVTVAGEIVNPGNYPYSDSMRLIDLVMAAGGPRERSYLKVAELTRYQVVEGKRESYHFEVNLGDALSGNLEANIPLQPHDELLIRTISNWRESIRVNIQGEVKYPGNYPVEEGEHLSSVLARAGGFTNAAYFPAAVFTRVAVREDEQKKIDELAQRTEAEVSRMENLSAALKDDVMRNRQLAKLEAAKLVVAQIKSARATGRIVIELSDIEKLRGTSFDLALRDGDQLYIPKRPDQVMVLGEVYNQTAFVYREHATSSDYLAMAGGVTRTGDDSRLYVMRANGMVDVVNNSWLGRKSMDIHPGDAVVVPQEIQQFSLLDSTLDWSRVLMQVGVSLASMKTIGVFK